MDISSAFVAHPQTAVLVQPTQRALHDPTEYAQAAFGLGVAAGQERLNCPPTKLSPVALRIVSPIPAHPLWPATGASHASGHGRDGVDQRQKLGHVVPVGCRDLRRQGNAVGVRDDMVFGPLFAAVCGVGPSLGPPKTARTEAESTTARDQSILSALRNFANSARWIFSHRPVCCQSRNRRQQVMPLPEPNSLGRYSQGMPVISTNNIPVRAWRLPIGLRPGYRCRRGLGGGNKGSSSAHNASSRIGFAIIAPPCTGSSLGKTNKSV